MEATLIVQAAGLTKADPIPDLHVPVGLTGQQKMIDGELHTEIEIGRQSYWVRDCFVDRQAKPLTNLPIEIRVTRYGEPGYLIGCLKAPPSVTDPAAAIEALWDEWQAETSSANSGFSFPYWVVKRNQGWHYAQTCHTVANHVGEPLEY